MITREFSLISIDVTSVSLFLSTTHGKSLTHNIPGASAPGIISFCRFVDSSFIIIIIILGLQSHESELWSILVVGLHDMRAEQRLWSESMTIRACPHTS